MIVGLEKLFKMVICHDLYDILTGVAIMQDFCQSPNRGGVVTKNVGGLNEPPHVFNDGHRVLGFMVFFGFSRAVISVSSRRRSPPVLEFNYTNVDCFTGEPLK